MAFDLYTPTRKLLMQACNEVADKAMRMAQVNAPKDSGRLAMSIEWISQGIGRYTVITNAVGDNGFPYPARIEAGEGVVPNSRNKYGAIWFKGNWHLAAAPSTQSGFMKKTVSNLHI